MKTSLVSVVIPAYNAEKFIERALQSVVQQTYQPIEIIVVDDGSVDKTEDVIKNFSNFSLIKYIKQKNSGPSKARNTGIIEACGEYIAFLDADDIWVNKEKIHLQIEKFKSNEGVVLVDTFAEVYWNDAKTVYPARDNSKTKPKDFLYVNCVNATSSVLVKKEALLKAGLFDEKISFGEDRLLWANVGLQGQLQTVKKVCIWKQNHSNNLSSKYFSILENRALMIKKLLKLIPIQPLNEKEVWLINYKEAFHLAWRNRDFSLYKVAYMFLLPYAKGRLLFSRYTVLYFALKFFANRVENSIFD